MINPFHYLILDKLETILLYVSLTHSTPTFSTCTIAYKFLQNDVCTDKVGKGMEPKERLLKYIFLNFEIMKIIEYNF